MAPYGTGKAAARYHRGMRDPLSSINNASRAVHSRTAGQRYNSGTTWCTAHDLRASLVRNHRSVGHAGPDRQRAHQGLMHGESSGTTKTTAAHADD
jgi:hypothetical protein